MMVKKVIIVTVILAACYTGMSYYFLDGRFTYFTSYCSHDLADSKKRALFIKNDLQIGFDTSNAELKNIITNNDFWIERHFNLTYYGLFFYHETEEKAYVKLRMEGKGEFTYSDMICEIFIDDRILRGPVTFPDSQITVAKGEKLLYKIYHIGKGDKIKAGEMTVHIN